MTIRGAGGKGGGGGKTPTESPDTLQSTQFARIVDVVSEGEIVGLVDGLRSVYLDGTPIQNSDDSVNFTGVTLETREGTQAQSYIPGFSDTEAETAVNVVVTTGSPVVRTLTDPDLNAVRVTVGVPQLFDATSGSAVGTTINLAIDVQDNGGGYVEKVNDIISGKTTSRYQRSYMIALTGTGPWDVRIRRITADSGSGILVNGFAWDSYTQIVYAKLRYPNSALVGIEIDAAQFQNIPTRGYDIKGLKVQIPSNYDPETRVYTGTWDGTFTTAWTDNPAWCFYDLVTNPRYGLGDFLDAAGVNKWVLYQIAQYCDELVPDGFGGTEPRFTCNLYLQTGEEALRVLLNMASIFRAIIYWGVGTLVTVQDSPRDAVALYTAANVVDGQFNYSGTSQKTRHTAVLVSWNDPTDQYRQKVEYVPDLNAPADAALVKAEIVGFGCTSRGQAHRLGLWMLYSERLEGETVTFTVGLDGVRAAPGQIIKISDRTRAGVRHGGRIVSATTTELVLDAAIEIEADKEYTAWVTLPDGSIASAAVTTAPSTTATLEVSPAFADAPLAQSIWIVAVDDLLPESWRVTGVAEKEGTLYEISGLAYRDDKFDAVERGLILQPLPVSAISSRPAAPTEIAVTEELYLVTPTVVGDRITVSWRSREPQFVVTYTRDGDNPVVVQTNSPSVQIQPAAAGRYTFSIVARNALGLLGPAGLATATIVGTNAIPADVSNLAAVALSGYAHLTWDRATDLTVLVGGSIKIRYTPDDVDVNWSSAVDIGTALPGTTTAAVVPLVPGSYLAKWISSVGVESATAAVISTDAANVEALNVVDTETEDPTFSGVKTNTAVSDAGLVLDSLLTIGDDPELVSEWPLISAIGGGFSGDGTYDFANTVDLGSVQTARLTAQLGAEAFDGLDLISFRSLVSTWPSVVGDTPSDAGALLYVRTTPDDPSGSPTWSDWQPFFVGDWTARGFQFQLRLFTEVPTHNVLVTQLAVTVDMPDRVESVKDIVSGAGAYSVTFVKRFVVTPAIGITAQNMQTGDYFVISSKSVAGFSVTFKNAAGTAVSRTFDSLAKGY